MIHADLRLCVDQVLSSDPVGISLLNWLVHSAEDLMDTSATTDELLIKVRTKLDPPRPYLGPLSAELHSGDEDLVEYTNDLILEIRIDTPVQ